MERDPDAVIRARWVWIAVAVALLVPATLTWLTILSGAPPPSWLPAGSWGEMATALGFPILAYLIGLRAGSRPLALFSLVLLVVATLLALLPTH